MSRYPVIPEPVIRYRGVGLWQAGSPMSISSLKTGIWYKLWADPHSKADQIVARPSGCRIETRLDARRFNASRRILFPRTHSFSMSFSRRRLPHIHPAGKWLFITWHLDGSLPQALFPPPGKMSDGKAFVWMDRYLDTTRKGPQYLLRPEIAAIVARSIQRGASLGQYKLRGGL
jgi:hypothetical protein